MIKLHTLLMPIFLLISTPQLFAERETSGEFFNRCVLMCESEDDECWENATDAADEEFCESQLDECTEECFDAAFGKEESRRLQGK